MRSSKRVIDITEMVKSPDFKGSYERWCALKMTHALCEAGMEMSEMIATRMEGAELNLEKAAMARSYLKGASDFATFLFSLTPPGTEMPRDEDLMNFNYEQYLEEMPK